MRLNMSRSAWVRETDNSSSSGQSVNADGLRIVVGKLLLRRERELDSLAEVMAGTFWLAEVELGMIDVDSEDSAGKKNVGTRFAVVMSGSRGSFPLWPRASVEAGTRSPVLEVKSNLFVWFLRANCDSTLFTTYILPARNL